MPKSNLAFTAPHKAATDAGMAILKLGGTATEAMVAAAATISVVYPHMNSIGGDGFWLIDNPGSAQPDAIDACGSAAQGLNIYNNISSIPDRGGESAITQAATIRGWQTALDNDDNAHLPLTEIFAPAIDAARNGFQVSQSLERACVKLSQSELRNQGFRDLYEPGGNLLKAGNTFKNSTLANVFEYLAKQGLNAFYEGELAESFAADLSDAGSVISLSDIQSTEAKLVAPLKLSLEGVDCFNLPAPTQGIHSLAILGIVDQLRHVISTPAQWAHLIVEATKQSFNLRPQLWGDRRSVTSLYDTALEPETLKQLADNISMAKAERWPFNSRPGDTVWMAARDNNGQMVSFIQSLYWEFGSGVVMKDGGFTWNNRGISFSLNDKDINVLAPGKKPAHTLNPAFARYTDGRRLAYGTMGGEGQPQTQAKIFTDYSWRNVDIQRAVASPRWLLGRTWGDASTNLKVEKQLADEIGFDLTRLRHDWQPVEDCNEMMGHAGAILDSKHSLQAAFDPRSDGSALIDTV